MNLVPALDSANNVACAYFGNMYVSVTSIYYVIDEDASVCWYQNLTLDVSHRNHTIKREGMCCLHNAIGIKRKSTFKVNF